MQAENIVLHPTTTGTAANRLCRAHRYPDNRADTHTGRS